MRKRVKNIFLHMVELVGKAPPCTVAGRMRVGMRLVVFMLVMAAGAAAGWASELSGNHLIMVTASNCPWCEAFEDEVGAGYPKTAEARILPLRRHDIYDATPADMTGLVPATMTPTFIIIRDGAEAGRIVGYPGAELFWWRLSEFTQ